MAAPRITCDDASLRARRAEKSSAASSDTSRGRSTASSLPRAPQPFPGPLLDIYRGINALAESFWQGLMRETMYQRLFTTMRQARLEIFQWLTYYNVRRRHSALNYLSPVEFEQQHLSAAKLAIAA
jgi:hypothetical protein